MTIAVLAIALLASAALVTVGLRGRRVDDHPLCRRCGYDLTGRPASSDRCGECGADLSRPRAGRVGHRVRRRWPLAVGTAALVVWGAGTGLLAAGWGRAVNAAPYEPTWWLRHELGGAPADRDTALAELAARARDGRLPAGQVGPIADRALAAQAGGSPWDPAWGTFVEAAHAGGRLDRPRWARYLRQGFDVVLSASHADPEHRAGLFYVVEDLAHCRRAGANLVAFFDVTNLRVDGAPVAAIRPVGPPRGGRIDTVNGGFTAWGCQTRLDEEDMLDLPAGRHRLTATIQFELFDPAQVARLAGGRTQVRPAGVEPLASVRVERGCPFDLTGRGAAD